MIVLRYGLIQVGPGRARPPLLPLEHVLVERQALYAHEATMHEARFIRGTEEVERRARTIPIAGISIDRIEPDIRAILRGRLMKYMIRADQIVIGRSTSAIKVRKLPLLFSNHFQSLVI